jgi:hypothetical protein
MRQRQVDGLRYFTGGVATVQELSIGTMLRLRRDIADADERGLAILSAALVEPMRTVAQLASLPMAAMGDINRLFDVVMDMHKPEAMTTDPPA